MRLSLFLFLVLISSTMTSCLKTRVTLSEAIGNPTYERSHNFFLWGLTPSSIELTTSELCGTNARPTHLESKTTFVDALLTVITLGILSPKTLAVRCLPNGG